MSRSPTPRRPARKLPLLLVAALPIAAAESGAEDPLSAVRRAFREEGPRSQEAARLGGAVDESGGLSAVRLRAARIAAALTSEDFPAAAVLAEGFDGTPLGLPGLGPFLRIEAENAGVAGRLAYAAAERYEPFARAALGRAARNARSSSERTAVRSALSAWEARNPRGTRAAIARSLSLARVASGPAEARALLLALARAVPDAPERAFDSFDDFDLKEWNAALRSAPEEIRLARALTLVARSPKEALALLPRAPSTGAARLDAAEVRLAAGETKDALRLLRTPARPAFSDDVSTRRADALELVAEMRLLARPSPAPRTARRAARRAGAAAPAAPRVLSAAEAARARELLSRADERLLLPQREIDRRRLLESGARLALLAGRKESAFRLIGQLVHLDPSSGAAAEDLFRAALDLYRAGHPADAAAHFDEIGALYREPALRRRATYWSARSRERGGDEAAARPLFASLLPGTSADVYAHWAARALDVPLQSGTGSPLPESAGTSSAGPGEEPGPRATELLACGFPDLAEDAAEDDGLADPVFFALLASERGDHRRAAYLLKRRWPELGTPEEGSVPPAARRAYYPLGHYPVVRDAARAAGLPEALVLGVIRQESVFSSGIRSRAGAVGLMQLLPATGRSLHRRESRKGRPDLLDPEVNVRLGATYLKQLLDQFDGDLVLALFAYNAGPGRARRWRRDFGALPPDEFVESIPLSESRYYVKRVIFFEGAYAALYDLPRELPAALSTRPSPAGP